MNFKNVVIFILSLTTVWIVVVFFCYKGYLTNIEVGQIQLDDRPYFTTQDSVVFDTGADFSFIPSNNIGFPIFLFLSLVYDGDGNNKILPMYFTQYFEVNDKVKIKNFTYISGFKNNRFKAIIGMNVLSKLNILFLSTQNTLDIKSFDFKGNFFYNTITSIEQDTLGFMWLGLDNGVFLFDGYSLQPLIHSMINAAWV